MTLPPTIQLLRPHQYIKNLFVFLPLFFALKITQADLLLNAFWAFVSFSLSASSVYILNDLLDIEEDRRHPLKRRRPLASGAISRWSAALLMATLVVAGVIVMAFLNNQALVLLVIYLSINILYSMVLKHIAIIDIVVIAIGFVLRIFVGAKVADTPLSVWIVVMTFLLALFLAFAKRRDDVLIFNRSGETTRKSIDGYNLKFVETAMSIMAAVVIVAYILYTITPEITHRLNSDNLYLTSIFVVIGILRYLQISFVEERSGSPTLVVLKDGFMQLSLLGWLGMFAWIIYL